MGGRAGGGIPGLPWTRGGSSGGFDFAQPASQGVFAKLNQQALSETLASIDASIKDPKMKAEMKAAVEKMSKEMGGLPTGMKVEIGTAKGFQGYEWHGKVQGKTITLNKKIYGGSYDKAEGRKLLSIKAGISTSTNKPAIQTFVHEFGHKYYDRLSSGGKMKVEQVFSHFSTSKSTKGWGSYAKKSASEFYADAVAKSVLGGSDKWTKALGKIK